MSKAVIKLCYSEYVMEADEAIFIARAMANAERFTTKGYGKETTYHVWEEDRAVRASVEFISDHAYRTGKAAGKPADRD